MQEYMNVPMILNGRPFYPRSALQMYKGTSQGKRDTVYEDLIIYKPMEKDGMIGVDVAEGLAT